MDTFIYMINVSIIYLCTRLWYSRKAPLVVTLEASSRDQLFSAQGFYWSIIHVSINSNHPSSTHLSSLCIYLFILHVCLSHTYLRFAIDFKSIHPSIYPSRLFIYQVYWSINLSVISMYLTHICVWLSTSSLLIYQFIHHVYSSVKPICLSIHPSCLFV